jgi:hypothetical protein
MIVYVEGAEYKFKEDCGLNTIILMILNAYVQRTRKSKSPGTCVLVAMQNNQTTPREVLRSQPR